LLGVVHGRTYDAEAYRSQDQDIEPSHLFGPAYSTQGLRKLGSCMIGLMCSNLCWGLKSELSVLDRHYLQTEKNPEFAIRDYAADVESVVCRDDVHVTGIDLFRRILQLTSFMDNTLECSFTLVEHKVQQLKDYVGKWLQFQSLWDLEAEYVFNRLGDSLANNWQQLLTEIKKARSTCDTSDTQKSFWMCVIDYEQMQGRVNAKYDVWQRDVFRIYTNLRCYYECRKF
jgi:hypothetical protein